MIAAVVQARMSSRRLPGKVLRPLAGRPTLEYMVERLRRSREIDELVVATSREPDDDAIEELCERLKVACHRGPLADAAQRFLEVCDRWRLSAFVRVSGDSPLIDQRLVDRGVELFRAGEAEIVTNGHPKTFPSGQSLEVVSAETFRRVLPEMTHEDEREHVTQFFYRHAERFDIENFTADRDDGELDLSLDTQEDAELIEEILGRMDRPHWEYTSAEAVDLYHAVERDRAGPARGLAGLRAAVIGLGVGEQHARGYEQHAEVEVVALCDFAPERLEAAAERRPDVRLTAAARDVIDDPGIDIVSVASWDSFHFEQVRGALENGKHVFVEKPLCLREEEAAEIAALLRARPDLRLSSNLPLRMSPRFRLLRRMIEEGRFGRLFLLEGDYDYGRLWKLTEGWRGDEEYYSVVLGGAVHLVDLLLWLTGDSVERVTARGNGIATEDTKYRFDDLVVATLELESGALAKVTANFGCVHPHFHEVRVFGTEATFVNGLPDATLYTRAPDGGTEPVSEAIDAPYPGVGKGDLIHSFVESIRTGGPAVISAEEVFRTMSVCFAIEKAAASGGPVTVEELYPR